jgi:hypothetical protein
MTFNQLPLENECSYAKGGRVLVPRCLNRRNGTIRTVVIG